MLIKNYKDESIKSHLVFIWINFQRISFISATTSLMSIVHYGTSSIEQYLWVTLSSQGCS